MDLPLINSYGPFWVRIERNRAKKGFDTVSFNERCVVIYLPAPPL